MNLFWCPMIWKVQSEMVLPVKHPINVTLNSKRCLIGMEAFKETIFIQTDLQLLQDFFSPLSSAHIFASDQWKKAKFTPPHLESLTNHESARSLLYFFDKVRLTSSQAQTFIQYRFFVFFWQTAIYLCDCSSSKQRKYQTEWPPQKKNLFVNR